MARINNTDTIKRILNDAKIQTSHDDVPQLLGKTVVPVLIANPQRFVNVMDSDSPSITGARTIYTTPTNKDFYLTGAVLSYEADATADNTWVVLQLTVGGEVQTLIQLAKLTTTASRETVNIELVTPILLTRGSAITHNTGFTAGTCGRGAAIRGYTVED